MIVILSSHLTLRQNLYFPERFAPRFRGARWWTALSLNMHIFACGLCYAIVCQSVFEGRHIARVNYAPRFVFLPGVYLKRLLKALVVHVGKPREWD